MQFNKFRKYLSEPLLLHAELPKLKEDWQKQFNILLSSQKRKKLWITAYYNVVLNIVVLVLLALSRVFMQRSIAELLVLNDGNIATIIVSYIALFITALLYLFFYHRNKGELIIKIAFFAYTASMAYFFIVMFLILWVSLGVNSAFIASLFAYVFLLYSPNRANLFFFTLYCVLYIIVILVISQSPPYKFIGIVTGIISPIVAWSIGEISYRGQVNDFLNIRQLEQQSNELEFAYNDIHRLNQLLNLENQRMGSELNVAQEIQSAILPRATELNLLNSLDVSAIMSPASEVGGDYYDFLVNDDCTKATIAIADVTGHGLESGIFTIMIQTAVRIIHNFDNIPIEQSLNILNKTLFDNAKRMESDKSLTFLLIRYSQGLVQIYGQHEEVILVRHNGEITIIDTFNLGFPFGLERDVSTYLACKEVLLRSGDSLILYTDGVTEASNKFREFYGTDRLHQVIKNNYYRSAEEIKQRIIYDLMEFIGATYIYDDITLVVIKQK